MSVAIMAILLGLLGTIFAFPMAAHAAVTEVTVYDDENVLDDAKVSKEISALESNEDVHIAVLTSDDPSLSENGYDEDVKALIDNGDYADIQGSGDATLKPDVVLISISPDLRKLGTYAGDDITRADQIADKAVGEMKSPARAGDWDQTAIAGAGSSLKSVNGDYERERKEQAEQFEKTMAKHGPTILNVFGGAVALVALTYVGVKIVPSIIDMISDRREEKRLLSWSPTQNEITRAIKYWKDIEQRLDALADESPAMEGVSRLASNSLIGRIVSEMEESGTVPDWVKTSPKAKALVEEGIKEPDKGGFWARNVQPLVDKVHKGHRDERLMESVNKASDACDSALHFVKKYSREISLPASDRAAIKDEAKALESTSKQARKMADGQEITPWDAAKNIDSQRKGFESLVRNTLRTPVREGMSEERRKTVSQESIFGNQSFLSAVLVYSAISNYASHSSHHSSHSSHHHSSPSYSAISTSISTSGFSGGSGSF